MSYKLIGTLKTPIFSTQGLEVSDVGMEGEGLVFIVYSDAIASMPGSFFWAILFFFMLITLGIDRFPTP